MRGETQVSVRVRMTGGAELEIELPRHSFEYSKLVELASAMALGLLGAGFDAHVVATKTVEQELHDLKKE